MLLTLSILFCIYEQTPLQIISDHASWQHLQIHQLKEFLNEQSVKLKQAIVHFCALLVLLDCETRPQEVFAYKQRVSKFYENQTHP